MIIIMRWLIWDWLVYIYWIDMNLLWSLKWYEIAIVIERYGLSFMINNVKWFMIVRLLRLWKWIWIAMTNVEIVIDLYDEIRYGYEMAIVNCNWDMLYKMKLLWTLEVLNDVHVNVWYWYGYWEMWLLYLFNEWYRNWYDTMKVLIET